MKEIILLGAGGHASVVLNILKQYDNIDIIGFTDLNYPALKKYKGHKILGTDKKLSDIYKNNQATHAFISLGSTCNNQLRKNLFNIIIDLGYKSLNIIHKNSVIAENIKLGTGNLISSGVNINPDVIIGNNNIINTGSIIEHGTKIGDHVHVAPGSILAGNVKVGNLSHIGLGARVIEGINIGKNCLIGAGAVIIEDVPDNSVVVGVPGEIIKKR
jgi:UDP-perosamine 4-acetyltransferase